jgi:hypothetical protein
MWGSIYSGGYGHRIRKIDNDTFRISWSYDTKIAGSRLRWPRGFSRVTDRAGAERFAKKWNTNMPKEAA